MVIPRDLDVSLTNAPPFVSVRFFCVTFLLGSLVRLSRRWVKAPSQEPLLSLIFGLIAGIFASNFRDELQEYIDMVKTSPRELLTFYIPLMSFGTAFCMDAHAFSRSFCQIIFLMTIGVISYTAVVASILKNLPTNWDWEAVFMFGAASACTAPRPIANLLNDLGAMLSGHVLFRICVGPIIGILAGFGVNYVLPMLYGDLAMEMLFTLVSAFVTFMVTERFLTSCGTLATIAMGIIVAGKRAAMEPADDLALVQFWEMICFLIDTSVYIIAGMVCTLTENTAEDPIQYLQLVLIYLVCFSVRFVVVSIQMPVLSHIGYGFSWTEVVLLSWGGLRGTSGLLLALHIATYERIKHIQCQIIRSMTCLVLLTLFVNGFSFPLVLRVMSRYGPSEMRRIDLQATYHDLAMSQKKTIADMRADKVVPETSWRLVQDITTVEERAIVPPPAAALPRLGCLICEWERETPETIRREALLRLFQLKKVGYWRQYSCGMLSTRALRLLLTAVGLAAERCRPAALLAEIKPSWSTGRVLPLTRKWLIILTGVLRPTLRAPPSRKRIRTLLFRAVMSPLLARVMVLVMVLSLVPILWSILRHACDKNWFYWTMQVVDLTLYLFLMGEFVIKVVGLGIRQLITAPLNAVLVIILVITTVAKMVDLLDMADVISVCRAQSNSFAYWIFFMCIHILRVNIIIRIMFECVPFLLSAVDYFIDKRIIFGFEVGSSFVAVQQEVARALPVLHTGISQNLLRELRLNEQEERFVVARDLGVLQSERPALTTFVQTGQAIRLILNTQVTCIRGLTERGLLDYTSRDKILAYIRRKRKTFRNSIKDLTPRNPIDILLNLPWFDKDNLSTTLILEHVKSASFQYGDIVQSLHSPANGLFVVLSGMVRVTYEPTTEVLNALVDKGQLPVMDLFGALNFEDRLEDLIVAGRVFGEMSALTSRPHDASAVAETAVQAFWLPQTLVNSMFTQSAVTRQQMWLSVGSRVAQELLGQLPPYEKCGSKLGKARVEILTEEQPSLVLDSAEDVVLVQGILLDEDEGVMLKAPVLLPRAIRRLKLPALDDVLEAVLLAVPLTSFH